ncbi:MAG: coenzyme F430 synthase [Methanomicrobiales archaeon]|jgi:hypothetical protein|nr:coenzyme F430 synthase [Methanomicrobiales archaeon]
MQTLILDIVHGGSTIASYLEELGDTVDTVDIYRDDGTISLADAQKCLNQRTYKRVIHSVHLQVDHPLLEIAQMRNIRTQTHHEAVAEILSEWEKNGVFVRPRRMVEITGARGKTTTAYALASCLSSSGPGLLHCSAGIYKYPGKEKIGRMSITPASVLTIAREYWEYGMTWMICEESLGVSGYHDCAILTSDEDYSCAAETRSAIEIKKKSLRKSPCALLSGEDAIPEIPRGIPANNIVQIDGELAKYQYKAWEGTCKNPLFFLSQYRTALILAIASSLVLGVDPYDIHSFQPVEGRLSLKTQKNEDGSERTILDNSNSGTTHITTIEAAQYLRTTTNRSDIILCIGQDAHAVCENLSTAAIIEAIQVVRPAYIILVPSGLPEREREKICAYLHREQHPYQTASSLDEAENLLRSPSIPPEIPALCAVKTWR